MAENTVTSKDTPRQEEESLEQLSMAIHELRHSFEEIIIPHKDILRLFGYSITPDLFSDPWNDEISDSMTRAMEKIIIDVVDAIEDFEKQMNLVCKKNREQNKEFFKKKAKKINEEAAFYMVTTGLQGLPPEGRLKVIEHIKAHEKYHEIGLKKVMNMCAEEIEQTRASMKNPNMPADEWLIQFGKEATGGEV